MSAAAESCWTQVYPSLTRDYAGMFGALVARAEAQAIRLSLIYAVMDKSRRIESRHILSALAFWHYCESSTRLIFGDQTGDRDADRIREAIVQSPEGLTDTHLHALFSNNRTSQRLHEALRLLRSFGMILSTSEPSGGPKPMSRHFAVEASHDGATVPDYLRIAREICAAEILEPPEPQNSTKNEFNEDGDVSTLASTINSSNSYFVEVGALPKSGEREATGERF